MHVFSYRIAHVNAQHWFTTGLTRISYLATSPSVLEPMPLVLTTFYVIINLTGTTASSARRLFFPARFSDGPSILNLHL